MNKKYDSIMEKLSDAYSKNHNHDSGLEKIIYNEKKKHEKKALNNMQQNIKPQLGTTIYDRKDDIIKIYDGVEWQTCKPSFVLRALKYKDKLEAKTIYDDLESTLET
jgi:hypothetical protein